LAGAESDNSDGNIRNPVKRIRRPKVNNEEPRTVDDNVLRSGELQFLIWATEGMSGADIEMLVEAGKRFFVLHGPSKNKDEDKSDQSKTSRPSIVLEGLRRQAALNARLFSPDRAALLNGQAEALDEALNNAGLTQADRGAVLDLSQSAVSRLRKRGEAVEVLKEAGMNA
jgi:hypothetical protein